MNNRQRFRQLTHTKRRTLYQLKRKKQKWILRKAVHYLKRTAFVNWYEKQRKKPYETLVAPINYSFIENTSEVLGYFKSANKLFSEGHNVNFDIANIENLTPDTIALHVSYITNQYYTKNCLVTGNYPRRSELNTLFTQSGFNRFVNSDQKKLAKSDGNYLHRERRYKVEPLIAQSASLQGIRHVFGNERPYEPLYNVLIECMSNTNNHASISGDDKTFWWLYVYNDAEKKTTAYSFLDLGVGIFASIERQSYFSSFLSRFLGNSFGGRYIDLVPDLLAGRIQSRIDEDNEIRGKGIPQIVDHSQKEAFKKFFIVSNDVKIDLKSQESEQLKHPFAGTFLYWEIQKN